METHDHPAFASVGFGPSGDSYCQTGLTKREYFAAKAMQGLLSANVSFGVIATNSIILADALIAELEESGK